MSGVQEWPDGRSSAWLHSVDLNVDPAQTGLSLDALSDRLYEKLLAHDLEPVMSSATREQPQISVSWVGRAHTARGAIAVAQAILMDSVEGTVGKGGAGVFVVAHHHVELMDRETGLPEVPVDVADPAERLRALRVTLGTAKREREQAVRDARAVGLSWAQIGECAGLPRQEAHRRWRDLPEARQ